MNEILNIYCKLVPIKLLNSWKKYEINIRNNRIIFNAFYYHCIANDFTNSSILDNEKFNLFDTTNQHLKLNNQALNDILLISQSHVTEYINGNILYLGTESGEAGFTNLKIPFYKNNLNYQISFKTQKEELISINKLTFKSLSFSHPSDSEPEIAHVKFETTSPKYKDIEIFYDSPITLLLTGKNKKIIVEKAGEEILIQEHQRYKKIKWE